MEKTKNKISGFTLIELLVTISIIAILTGVTIFGLTSIRQKAQDTAHLSGIQDLRLSLEAYRSVNGKYPAAGTAGTASYINGLAPTFISKLPVDSPLNSTTGYQYSVDTSDYKTYCIYVKSNIFKPQTQPDYYVPSCPNTWVACKGVNAATLSTCSGTVSS